MPKVVEWGKGVKLQRGGVLREVGNYYEVKVTYSATKRKLATPVGGTRLILKKVCTIVS